MSFESIVDLVDKNKTSISSNDYLKIMNSLKKIYDSTIKTKIHSKKESEVIEESEEQEDMTYVNYTNNEDDDTYASLWK
jgi:hypothetical protein